MDSKGGEGGAGNPSVRVVGTPDDPAAIRNVREALRRPSDVEAQGTISPCAGHLFR